MEELQKLYDVLVREGKYTKSFEEFQSKWAQDEAYKNKVYDVVIRDGLYTKDKESFFQKYSTQAPVQSTTQEAQVPVKKKFALDSSSEVGSSESQESPKQQAPLPELTQEGFKQEMTKKASVPTDMSGKPMLNTEKVEETKQIFNKISKENQEIASEKKKYGDIFDKQLSIKPKVEESQYLKNRLSTINTELINREEEYVVPELEYQFGDLGFKFEESGATGDYVKVTAPNGKTTEISLDNLFDSKSKKQSDILQKFIKDNTPAKGLFVLEKTMREQDIKFNSEKQVDNSVKAISTDVTNLNIKQKQFLAKKAQFDKELKELGPNPNKESLAVLEQKRIALNDEMKLILQEEENIKQKGKKLDAAVGKYSIAKSKQGTWLGGIWNAINEGASSMSSGVTNLTIDLFTEIAPAEFVMSPKDLKDISLDIAKKIGVKGPDASQTIEQWKKTLTEDQLDNWEDEVDDYIKKDLKGNLLPAIRIGNREIFGDADTTKQWSNLKEQDFWGGAILGVAKSLPAMIGGTGPVGWAQRTAQRYAQVSDGLAQEMEQDPEFKNVSENEKLAITLPIGIVGAVLEEVGLKNIKGSQGLINGITLKVLGKSGKGVTAKSFRELVENEVDDMLSKGLLTVTAAGAAEFETGAAQELVDTSFKAIYNEIKGKEMFETPESTADLIENVVTAGAQEAVGGFVLGVPTAVSTAFTQKGFLKMDDDTFNTFANMANDEKMQSAYITSLKDKITRGVLTTAEAKDQLNNYRNSVGLFRQLPEGLTIEQQKEAMNLLKEKKDLENYINGKDGALVVKQKNRINEINDSLNKLSETDAVQEQSTTEIPVQSETGISETVAEGISEPKPEVITEQGTQEEIAQPLRDVESTSEALRNLDEKTFDEFSDKFMPDYRYVSDISEAYHKAKEEGSNPEFVKAVETLLTPKAEEAKAQTTNEFGIPPAPEGFDIVTEPLTIIKEQTEKNKNDFSEKSIEDLEKRQAELEEKGFKTFSKESKEFNEIDKELEKREWQSVLNAPLNEVVSIVDNLIIKDKEMQNGYGSYIEKSDAKQTKEIAKKYSQEVSKLDAKKDFKDAFFGRPESWYADALKMRESVRAFTEKGGSFKELLQGIQKEFEQDGFSEQDAAGVIKNKLDKISKANEIATEVNQPKTKSEPQAGLVANIAEQVSLPPVPEGFDIVTETAPVEETAVVDEEQDISSYLKNRGDVEDLKNRKDINHSSPKIEYNGDSQRIKGLVERYNNLTKKVEEDGSFSTLYGARLIEKLIRKGLDSNQTRKLSSALRKAGLLDVTSSDLTKNTGEGIGTYISDTSEFIANAYSYSYTDRLAATRILTKLAKELGIYVASAETEANRPVEKIGVKAKAETAPIELSPIEIQESRVESAKSLVQEAKTKAAKKKAMQDLVREESRLAEMKASEKVKAKAAPVAETKPKTESKIDKEIAQLEKDADYYASKIEDIQDEIKTEKQNTKEEVQRIKDEIAEVKNDKSLNRADKLDKIEDLKAEMQDIKDDQEGLIENYTFDLKEAKSEYKKTLSKIDRLVAKKEAKVDEVLRDVESTTKALKIFPFGKIKASNLFKLSGVKMPTKTDDFIRDAKERTTNTENGINFSNILLPDGNTIFDKLMNLGIRDIELTNLFELFRITIGRNSIDMTEQFKKDIFESETEGTSSEDIAEIIESLDIAKSISKNMQYQKNKEIAKNFRDTFDRLVEEGVLGKDLSPLVNEIANSFENNKLINVDSLYDLVSSNQDYNWANKISEAYHRAKKNGNNPKLVQAVESLLATKVDETKDLLNLDTKDKYGLNRVLDFLNKIDDSLYMDPNELNDVTRVMAINTAKIIVKTLKTLVNAGITLKEAIDKVAEIHSITSDKIIDALDIVSKINENKSEGISEMELPGFNDLSSEIDSQIDEGKSVKEVLDYVQSSETYNDATDVQKDLLVRDVRKRFGLSQKSAPSVGKLFGTIKDVKKITMREKDLLVKQLKDKAKGAKDVIAVQKEVAKEIAKEIKELSSTGKITITQAANIVSKFSKVNLLNETSVYNFVDYMSKVFSDAEYDNKINVAKNKLKSAKNNIVTKLGLADGLVLPLQRLFSINPNLIPEKYLDRYLELVNMFSARQQVLTLEEKSVVLKDVQDILDEIENEQSLSDELADRFESSDSKVFKDGVLDYSASIKAMLKNGEIDNEEADLMTKYKSRIIQREEKTKMTEEEIQAEKNVLVNEIKNSTINESGLPTRNEVKLAKEFGRLIRGNAINELTNTELKNVLKLIDNINNGYLPHYTQLMVEKMNSINNSKTLENAIDKSKLPTLSFLYSKAKSILTKKDAVLEMIRRNPLFYIDQVLGDFKTKDVFNSVLEMAAEGEANFTADFKKVKEKLDKAQNDVAKSFGLNPNKTLKSSFKMMTYAIQLEYESNKGNKQVNPAAEYLKATIKHINDGKSQFNEKDSKVLQEIYDEFSDSEGNINSKKLYDSFNNAEKKAIKTVRELNESLTDKAEYTSAIIRGQKINPLTNYIHLNVLHDSSPTDISSGPSFINDYNNSMRPSTKAKSLIERTGKVSPLNFDIFSSAERGAKFVLMDYNLTEPIRTARKTINRTISNLEKDGKMSDKNRKVVNGINQAVEEAIENLLLNSYTSTSIGDDVVNYISKQGYRAVLAGTGRFMAELLSNVGFIIISDPNTFTEGLKHTKLLMSPEAPQIMQNVNSKETNRIFPSDMLSGRLIDTSILSQSTGIRGGKTKNSITNRLEQIWNRTGKKYKNSVELTADYLISTPDKAIMRPIWFGSFANQFEKMTGQKVDFKKIAENDSDYMEENREAIDKAKNIADERSVITGASSNAFSGILKGTSKANQSATIKGFNNFNNFMTRFLIYEYVTARTGIYAAMGNGSLSRRQGVALLGAVTTRMTVYSLLAKALGSGVIGLLFDDEEEEEKSIDKQIGQALASTFTSMLLGRDFGNATKTLINYGVERINEEYLDFLREGDYDPYKDAIQYTSIPSEEKGKQTDISDFILKMGGSFGPALNTADLILKKSFEVEKKEEDAIERSNKEKNVRVPLEVLGNLGFIPLYKDIRKSVLKDIYKGLEDAKEESKVKAEEREIEKEKLGGYKNKTEMKKDNPKLYEETFPKKKESSFSKQSFGSKDFGSSKSKSTGFGSKKFGAN